MKVLPVVGILVKVPVVATDFGVVSKEVFIPVPLTLMELIKPVMVLGLETACKVVVPVMEAELKIKSTAVRVPRVELNWLNVKLWAVVVRFQLDVWLLVEGTANAAEAAPKSAIPRASDLMGFFIWLLCLMV